MKILRALIICAVLLTGLPSLGQTEMINSQTVVSQPLKSFFVKASGGFDYSESTFTYYNPTASNLNNNVFDTYWTGFHYFTGSLAAGFEFPGWLSLFASS